MYFVFNNSHVHQEKFSCQRFVSYICNYICSTKFPDIFGPPKVVQRSSEFLNLSVSNTSIINILGSIFIADNFWHFK